MGAKCPERLVTIYRDYICFPWLNVTIYISPEQITVQMHVRISFAHTKIFFFLCNLIVYISGISNERY